MKYFIFLSICLCSVVSTQGFLVSVNGLLGDIDSVLKKGGQITGDVLGLAAQKLGEAGKTLFNTNLFQGTKGFLALDQAVGALADILWPILGGQWWKGGKEQGKGRYVDGKIIWEGEEDQKPSMATVMRGLNGLTTDIALAPTVYITGMMTGVYAIGEDINKDAIKGIVKTGDAGVSTARVVANVVMTKNTELMGQVLRMNGELFMKPYVPKRKSAPLKKRKPAAAGPISSAGAQAAAPAAA